MIAEKTLKHEELLVLNYQKTGDSAIFGALYAMFYEQLYNYVFTITKSAEDAFDITQDAFIKASTEIHQLRQAITFRFWLFRVAKNMCIRQYKMRNRLSSVLYEKDTFCQDYDTSEAIEKDNELEKLGSILKNLPFDEQELLVAKYAMGSSVKELMASTGLGSSAIKMKLMRSRNKVKEAFAQSI